MSKVDIPWTLPDRTVTRADEADREIRISDFALMAVLPLRSLGIASAVPANEVALALLVVLCLFRASRGGARLGAAVALPVAALLVLLTYSGVANDLDWTRRMGHLAIMAGVIWALGTGRVSLRSAGAGLAAGLCGVIVTAAAGVGGNPYAGRLTGYLGDPNAGAYFIVALGPIAIFFCDERRVVRFAVAVPLLAGLVLVYSRTGLLAGAFVALWLLFGRRLGEVASAVVALATVWGINNIPSALTTIGPFSDRSGSDKLRERIIAQEQIELASAPWYGHGPGSATVDVRGLSFFFHNSYLATRQEGGWIALLLVLGLLVLAFLRVSPVSRAGNVKAAAIQGAVIATAVMAITLGEVLLDSPVAIVVGFALGHMLMPESQPTEGPDG